LRYNDHTSGFQKHFQNAGFHQAKALEISNKVPQPKRIWEQNRHKRRATFRSLFLLCFVKQALEGLAVESRHTGIYLLCQKLRIFRIFQIFQGHPNRLYRKGRRGW
jgi:hypothetical protein